MIHCRVASLKSIGFKNRLGLNQYNITLTKSNKKELSCEVIRNNPDEKYFNNLKAINEIHKH